ncbi:hypothetical protein [Methylophilus sp.]|uniref:hypothetical protein n=1 Tax=Methylophilus sp. TaxID=29541 RepID=UPI0040368FC7
MRNQQKPALSDHYRNMIDEALVDLYAKGRLTDVTSETIREIFIERGASHSTTTLGLGCYFSSLCVPVHLSL